MPNWSGSRASGRQVDRWLTKTPAGDAGNMQKRKPGQISDTVTPQFAGGTRRFAPDRGVDARAPAAPGPHQIPSRV